MNVKINIVNDEYFEKKLYKGNKKQTILPVRYFAVLSSSNAKVQLNHFFAKIIPKILIDIIKKAINIL